MLLSKTIELAERLALKTKPGYAIALLNRLPPSAISLLQRIRFRETLKLAAKSEFYSQQFKARNIDIRKIKHPAELGDFFTTSDDLQKYGAEAFIVNRPDTAFETTGTTSSLTKRVFFSNRELNEMGRVSALGLHQIGLRKDDIVLSAFDVSFWVSPAVLRTAFQYLGCFHAEAGKIAPAEFYERAARYRPTVIFGEPSWLVRVSEIADQRGVWPIKFLFAGGENIAEETRHEVERIWNAPFHLNYGQTESFGVIGVECAEHDGYHRNDPNFFFEIPEINSEGYGELVYTTLTRDVMPLVRYRSTDVTRMIDDPCKCGLFAKRIAKLKGRVDEMVVCGMGNISPWVFGEMLSGVDDVTDEWQVRIWHEDLKDVIEILVESDFYDNPMGEESILTKVKENLRTKFPDFQKNLEMQLYCLRVSPVRRGSLRTGRKLRRLVVLGEPPKTEVNGNGHFAGVVHKN
ncbi:phenylacetate--CoA ligase [soil metagenome]